VELAAKVMAPDLAEKMDIFTRVLTQERKVGRPKK